MDGRNIEAQNKTMQVQKRIKKKISGPLLAEIKKYVIYFRYTIFKTGCMKLYKTEN